MPLAAPIGAPCPLLGCLPIYRQASKLIWHITREEEKSEREKVIP